MRKSSVPKENGNVDANETTLLESGSTNLEVLSLHALEMITGFCGRYDEICIL